MDKTITLYFDTETTGLGTDAEIIQVGIIDDTGKVYVDTLVQCQGEIPAEATAIHGITKEDLANAPTWPEIHDQIYTLLWQADYVKIYNARYDLRLLGQTARRYELEVPQVVSQCVMKAYGKLHFDGDWIKLTEACQYEKIDTSEFTAHNAVADCQMTRLLDIEIMKEVARREKRAEYRKVLHEKKMALVPKNPHTYPHFGMARRPRGCKTLSQLSKRDLSKFTFAGMCCDTYGNQGYLFMPKGEVAL